MSGLKTSGISNSCTKPVYQSRATEWNRRNPGTSWRDRPNRSSNSGAKPQMFYCETCKISCAGPESFAEHQKGKKHIRMEKAEATKAGRTNPAAHVIINCVICEVPCTGREAYEAHLKGTKHQRVIALLQRLGKPIPQIEPIPVPLIDHKSSDTGRIKVLGTPKINFTSGGRLHTTQLQPGSTDLMTESIPGSSSDQPIDSSVQEETVETGKVSRKDPVGEDYVESIKETGKSDTYYCKLCDCNFNDDASRHAHVRGRRHRLAYKKKVDPSLIVDIKPSDARSRYVTEREKRQMKERVAKKFPARSGSNYGGGSYGGGSYGGGSYGGGSFTSGYAGAPREGFLPSAGFSHSRGYYDSYGYPPADPYADANPYTGGPYIPPPLVHQLPMDHRFLPGPTVPIDVPPNSVSLSAPSFAPISVSAYSQDDHLVVHKEGQLRPCEDESDDIYHLVTIVEKALKLVSDKLIDEDVKSLLDDVIAKKFNVHAEEEEPLDEGGVSEVEKAKQEIQSKRALKGLQRVGPLADDLLLPGEGVVDVVVICGEKPTKELLHRVGTALPGGLEVGSFDT